MKKEKILSILKSRLEKHEIQQKDLILEWVDELIEEPVEKNDILLYCEKLYEKKYPDEIFLERPISPKLRLEVHNFQRETISDFTEYKKFAEWLVQMCPNVAGRKMIPFDLANVKLYNKFKERQESDTEIIVQKKALNKNRLIKI